jgi:hypothetical protein
MLNKVTHRPIDNTVLKSVKVCNYFKREAESYRLCAVIPSRKNELVCTLHPSL